MTQEELIEIEKYFRKKYIMIEKTFDVDLTKNHSRDAFMNNVIAETSKYFGLPVEKIKSKYRGKFSLEFDWRVAEIRSIVVVFLRTMPESKISFAIIGKFLNMDHASAIYSERSFYRVVSNNAKFKADYLALEKNINESLRR